MTEHSALSASGCKLWSKCPGMVNFTDGLESPASEYSTLGTAAHKLGELCLRGFQETTEYVGRIVEGVEVDEKMAEAVQAYVDVCRPIMHKTADVWIERKFALDVLNPPRPMFGTSDFSALDGDELVIVDYKHGFVFVDVKGNVQLRYYALGVLLSLPPRMRVARVRIVVVQPNAFASPVREEIVDVEDLLAWSFDLLDLAQATMPVDAPLVPGSHCHDWHCKADGRCPAQTGSMAAVVEKPVLLTPEQVVALYERLDEVKATIAGIEDEARRLAHLGQLPGWKIVPTDPREVWKVEAEAAEMLVGIHDFDEAEVYKPAAVISPATARNTLAARLHGHAADKKYTKKQSHLDAKAALAPLVSKSSGGTKLVRSTDPRVALPTGGAELEALPPLIEDNS